MLFKPHLKLSNLKKPVVHDVTFLKVFLYNKLHKRSMRTSLFWWHRGTVIVELEKPVVYRH